MATPSLSLAERQRAAATTRGVFHLHMNSGPPIATDCTRQDVLHMLKTKLRSIRYPGIHGYLGYLIRLADNTLYDMIPPSDEHARIVVMVDRLLSQWFLDPYLHTGWLERPKLPVIKPMNHQELVLHVSDFAKPVLPLLAKAIEMLAPANARANGASPLAIVGRQIRHFLEDWGGEWTFFSLAIDQLDPDTADSIHINTVATERLNYWLAGWFNDDRLNRVYLNDEAIVSIDHYPNLRVCVAKLRRQAVVCYKDLWRVSSDEWKAKAPTIDAYHAQVEAALAKEVPVPPVPVPSLPTPAELRFVGPPDKSLQAIANCLNPGLSRNALGYLQIFSTSRSDVPEFVAATRPSIQLVLTKLHNDWCRDPVLVNLPDFDGRLPLAPAQQRAVANVERKILAALGWVQEVCNTRGQTARRQPELTPEGMSLAYLTQGIVTVLDAHQVVNQITTQHHQLAHLADLYANDLSGFGHQILRDTLGGWYGSQTLTSLPSYPGAPISVGVRPATIELARYNAFVTYQYRLAMHKAPYEIQKTYRIANPGQGSDSAMRELYDLLDPETKGMLYQLVAEANDWDAPIPFPEVGPRTARLERLGRFVADLASQVKLLPDHTSLPVLVGYIRIEHQRHFLCHLSCPQVDGMPLRCSEWNHLCTAPEPVAKRAKASD